MVVIVIIGLLATVVMINVMPSQDRAMIEKARADVSTLEQAVETYRLENLVYPRTDQGLDALLHAPSGLARPERYRTEIGRESGRERGCRYVVVSVVAVTLQTKN